MPKPAPRGAKRARPATSIPQPVAHAYQLTAVKLVNDHGAKAAAELLVMRQFAELQILRNVIDTARARAADADGDANPTFAEYRDALDVLEGELDPELPSLCPDPVTHGRLDRFLDRLDALETRLADTIVPADVISRLAATEYIASADENVLNRLARIETRLGIDPRDARSWIEEFKAARRVPITAGDGEGIASAPCAPAAPPTVPPADPFAKEMRALRWARETAAAADAGWLMRLDDDPARRVNVQFHLHGDETKKANAVREILRRADAGTLRVTAILDNDAHVSGDVGAEIEAIVLPTLGMARELVPELLEAFEKKKRPKEEAAAPPAPSFE